MNDSTDAEVQIIKAHREMYRGMLKPDTDLLDERWTTATRSPI
jgi:hypothetical protein